LNQRKKAKRSQETRPANWPDVAIHFLDVVASLFKGGYIYGALALLITALFSLIIWRIPENELPNFVLTIWKAFEGCMFGYAVLSALIIILLTIIIYQKKFYKVNIAKVAAERSEAIHVKNPKKLGIHLSSKLLHRLNLSDDHYTD
jgi:hypothetical protein